jgi:cytochrome P450
METEVKSPDGEVYWDPIDPALRDDPYSLWKRLRDEAPAYHNDRFDFYVYSRFADVEAAHRDPKTFSSAHGTVLELMQDEPFETDLVVFNPGYPERLREGGVTTKRSKGLVEVLDLHEVRGHPG